MGVAFDLLFLSVLINYFFHHSSRAILTTSSLPSLQSVEDQAYFFQRCVSQENITLCMEVEVVKPVSATKVN